MAPEIIAHRGASHFAKENSIAAFKKAIEHKAGFIEFDVRRTKDYKYIVNHDATLHKQPLHELTYKDVKKLDPEIPLLKDVLKITKNKIKLDIELKEVGQEKEILAIILKKIKPDSFVITTFNDESVKAIKALFPNVTVGLLLGREHPKKVLRTRFSELFPLKRINACNADFVAPNYQLFHFGFLKRMKKHNLPVFVWTVNTSKLLDKYCNHPLIDAVITDLPHIALERIKNTN